MWDNNRRNYVMLHLFWFGVFFFKKNTNHLHMSMNATSVKGKLEKGKFLFRNMILNHIYFKNDRCIIEYIVGK